MLREGIVEHRKWQIRNNKLEYLSNMTLASIKFYSIHIIVAVITLACFLMNGPMRDGLPLDNTLDDRITFIAENSLVWSMSWCVWMLSALGLFVFSAILADELNKTFLRTVGLSLVAMGVAPDLIAEVLYAFVIPEIIQNNISSEMVQTLEIISAHLTGFLGNGLYNLGGMLLTLLGFKEGLLKPWIVIWGVTSWSLGFMLSAAIAVDSMIAAELFTASSMVLSTTWMLIFAHKVLKR